MMNSEIGVEGGGGIGILGDIHNSTGPEQPDLTSSMAILQVGCWDLKNSSLTKMSTH